MPRKKNVLFVCIGNICRSPMAEAFARKYGADVLDAQSAGLSPAINTSELTRLVLDEKNVDLGAHLPRKLTGLNMETIDLVVNLSGHKLPVSLQMPVEEWKVRDPIGETEEVFRQVRDQIEMLVMRLILDIRAGKFDSTAKPRPVLPRI